MRNNLYNILNDLNVKIETDILNEIILQINLKENTCFFLFDIQSDKCSYLCPSISEILGHCHKNYLNKSFLYYIRIIHPNDISNFIEEILTLIKLAENRNKTIFSLNNSGLSVRIRHKNGDWLKSKVYLLLLKNTNQENSKILLGFIESDIPEFEDNATKTLLITYREKEIFKYLSIGNSAKMIAEKLHISENTVITHRKKLILKLEVKNSAELIKKGFEIDILNLPTNSSSLLSIPINGD